MNFKFHVSDNAVIYTQFQIVVWEIQHILLLKIFKLARLLNSCTSAQKYETYALEASHFWDPKSAEDIFEINFAWEYLKSYEHESAYQTTWRSAHKEMVFTGTIVGTSYSQYVRRIIFITFLFH
jgi:hypothetical protein